MRVVIACAACRSDGPPIRRFVNSRPIASAARSDNRERDKSFMRAKLQTPAGFTSLPFPAGMLALTGASCDSAGIEAPSVQEAPKAALVSRLGSTPGSESASPRTCPYGSGTWVA